MKRYEFTGTNELSEKAFEVYSNSSFTFYKEGNSFYMASNSKEEPTKVGTLSDIDDFLLSFADEEG